MPVLEIKHENIFFDPKVQTMCVSKSFTCPHYNHSHSCPPVAPYLENEISEYKKYYLIYSIFNLSNYVKEVKDKHPNRSEFRIKNSFYLKNIYGDDLEKEFNKFLDDYKGPISNILLLYDGTCRICHNEQDEDCTYDSGKPCRYPEKIKFSMEAVGIEVIRTVLNLKNRDFEYPSNTYAYRFGLICIK